MAESVEQTNPERGRAVAMDLALETPDGLLRGRMAIPAGPMRLAELAWNAMALDERIIGLAVRREAGEGRAISCCKGCGACCRQLVPLSPPEAWMIADLVAALPAGRREAAAERFRDAAKLLLEKGFRERLLAGQPSDEEVIALGRDYFFLGLPCPFLEEESCSIHPYRPSICREYLVTSPAEFCGDPFTRPVRRIQVSVRLSQALARLTAELLGGEPQLIPLTLAPAWAVEHCAQGRREWDARELFERLLNLMSEK